MESAMTKNQTFLNSLKKAQGWIPSIRYAYSNDDRLLFEPVFIRKG